MAVTANTTTGGKVVRWRRWTFANLGALLSNFGSVWFLVAPRRLLQTYFNLVLRRRARCLLAAVDPYLTVDIPDPGAADAQRSRFDGRAGGGGDNTYEEVKAYLSGACSAEARELRAEGAAEGRGLVIRMRDGQDVADEFKGVTMWWSSVDDEQQPHHGGGSWQGQGQQSNTRCSQRLTFHQRHRPLVVDEYLPHVRRRGREILFHNRRSCLYTNNKNPFSSIYRKAWSYINFDHPTTFDTLAMEPAKKEIMDDLDVFQQNIDFYL